MSSNSTVVPLRQPDTIDDPLMAILRSGARRLLAQAIEAEADAFLAIMKDQRLSDRRERVVRPGHGPERLVQTGIGPVAVGRVKLRDRGAGEAGAERIRFTSAILPRWARRTRSLDALLPILYLRGVSMGDFQEALASLLGKNAPNLSPRVIARLRNEWEADYEQWQRRDLSARRYVYIWADGVYLQARMEPQTECMLMLIGATPEGRKELLGCQVGMRDRRPVCDLSALHDLRYVTNCKGPEPRHWRSQRSSPALTRLILPNSRSNPRRSLPAGTRHRATALYPVGRWDPTMMRSCASVAKLRGGAPGKGDRVRLIAEQHIVEDLGRIPSFADWSGVSGPSTGWVGSAPNSEMNQPAPPRRRTGMRGITLLAFTLRAMRDLGERRAQRVR